MPEKQTATSFKGLWGCDWSQREALFLLGSDYTANIPSILLGGGGDGGAFWAHQPDRAAVMGCDVTVP